MVDFSLLNGENKKQTSWWDRSSLSPTVPEIGKMNFTTSAFDRVTSPLMGSDIGSLGLDKSAYPLLSGSGDLSSIGKTVGGASWWDKAMGYTDPKTGKTTGGFVSPVLGALSAGLQFYTGKEQLGLAKDQLSTQKQQFADQFNTQKQLINMDIQAQGKRRYARSPSTNLTPEEYYEKHKIV